MSETTGKEFANVVGRELDRLAELINSHGDANSLWQVAGKAKNSPATLALHLCGNLEHYIGAHLGHTGYVRDRRAEFADRSLPKEEILRRIASSRSAVTTTLENLDDDALTRTYPGETGAVTSMGEVTVHHFLIHLTWHLGWHLGQIDYHLKLLSDG